MATRADQPGDNDGGNTHFISDQSEIDRLLLSCQNAVQKATQTAPQLPLGFLPLPPNLVLDKDRPISADLNPVERLSVAAPRPFTAGTRFPSTELSPEAVRKQIWAQIIEALDAAQIKTSHLQLSQYRRLLPTIESTPESLAIWAQLFRNSPSVNATQLAKCLNLKTTTQDDAASFEDGCIYYYIRSWTLTTLEARAIVEHLIQDGYTHNRLADWLNLIAINQQEGIPFFTFRYAGKVTGPRTPTVRWQEDIDGRRSGLLFEFMTAIETLFPELAAGCVIQTVLDATIEFSRDVLSIDDRERVLLQLLGLNNLLNSQLGGFFANYVPSHNDSLIFAQLKTDFFHTYDTYGSNTSRDVVNSVTGLFRSIQELIQENPSNFCPPGLPFTDKRRDVCINQGVPKFQLYGETLIVLIGKDNTVGEYTRHEEYLSGYSQSGQILRSFLTRLAQEEAANNGRKWTEIAWIPPFPFVDLWPCPLHQEILEAIRWLADYLQGVRPIITASFSFPVNSIMATNLTHAHGLRRGVERIYDLAGVPTIQHFDGDANNPDSAFINIPHIDPGNDKYAKQSMALVRVIDMTWQYTLLIGDLAIAVLRENDENNIVMTRQALCQRILDEAAFMADTGVQDFMVQFSSAKKALRKKSRNRNLGGAITILNIPILNARGRADFAQLEFATGAPESPERRAQLNRLWEKHVAELHLNIPHEHGRRDQWMDAFLRLRQGQSLYLQVLSDLGDLETFRAIVDQVPEAHRFLKSFKSLDDASSQEKAMTLASASLLSQYNADIKKRRKLRRPTDFYKTTEMQGLPVTIQQFNYNQSAGYFTVRWLRSDTDRVVVIFYPPASTKVGRENDFRSLSFTKEGIDICDANGVPLRPKQSAIGGYKATFPAGELRSRDRSDARQGQYMYELWLAVMALEGYVPQALPSDDAKVWTCKKGVAFVPAASEVEVPLQNRPPTEGDANYLLKTYIDEVFPVGGWFRTSPMGSKPSSTANVQGFVDFLKQPEYVLHPFTQDWLAQLDRLKPHLQTLGNNLKTLRNTRQVTTRERLGSQTEISEVMFDLGMIGSAESGEKLRKRLPPGKRLDACKPCVASKLKCGLDPEDLESPCPQCEKRGIECERKPVAGLTEGAARRKPKTKKTEAEVAAEESDDDVAGPSTKRPKTVKKGKDDVATAVSTTRPKATPKTRKSKSDAKVDDTEGSNLSSTRTLQQSSKVKGKNVVVIDSDDSEKEDEGPARKKSKQNEPRSDDERRASSSKPGEKRKRDGIASFGDIPRDSGRPLTRGKP